MPQILTSFTLCVTALVMAGSPAEPMVPQPVPMPFSVLAGAIAGSNQFLARKDDRLPDYLVPTPGTPDAAADSKRGRAPCKIADGYQTVRFDNGAEYRGSFKDCKPLPGPAEYSDGSVVLRGHATPVGDNAVHLKTSTHEVTITLEIETVK